MRRFILTLAAAGVLAVLAPGSALAHHHARGRHGTRVHRVHSRRFGSDPTSSPTTPSGGIGTVSSFQNGVLTIMLNNNSTAVGTVTNDTETVCAASSGSQGGDESSGDDDQGSGDQGDQSSGNDDNSSGGSMGSSGGTDQGSGEDDQGQGDDDQGQANGGPSSCSSSDPTGKTVLFAELRFSSAGETWEKLVLGS